MPTVQSDHIAVTLDTPNGIDVIQIVERVSGHAFLTVPLSLFAFAVDNRLLRFAGPAVEVTRANLISAAELQLEGRARDEPVSFVAHLHCTLDSPAVLVSLWFTNTSAAPIFLRLVMPVTRGLVVPGPREDHRLALGQEVGSVVPLDDGPPIGMPLNLDVGLPTAMNTLEVACLYETAGGTGIFFADVGGDLENGIPPVQYVASAREIAGYWIATIAPGQSVAVPTQAIGVTNDGDWHAAVNFYVAQHRPRWRSVEAPGWLRDTGALYTYAGGGAGGILMAQPFSPLPAGALWNTWTRDDGPWRDGAGGRQGPVQISTAGFAPEGAAIASITRVSGQVEVFVVGLDGAIWATWETADSVWRDGRHGRKPVRISTPCLAPPGAPLVAAPRGDAQVDVFVVGHDGGIWVTWSRDNDPWQDGYAGRLPRRATPPDIAPPGAHLIAARQSAEQLDVFVVGHDGAILCSWSVNDSPWQDGVDGRWPVRITPQDFAPPGSPLAAAMQNDEQLNVFVVRPDGAIWVTWTAGNSPWRDDWQLRPPLLASPPEFAPVGAHLATARQRANQLDVFVVRNDGAIWVSWELDNGPWTDGTGGRHPVRISTDRLAPAGAPLAAAWQNDQQLDVFVIGHDGAIWTTWTHNNSPWRDGLEGRPGPVAVSPLGFSPASSWVATASRPSGQLDVYCPGHGRLRSFYDLPRLLEEARTLGTNIVYLYDYWEGSDASTFPSYWNKGDYAIRGDLGGEEALIEGSKRLHEEGGRLILYVEPFIIYRYSEVALAQGDAWAARWPDGRTHEQYPDNLTMAAPLQAWQDYMIAVCERLICLLGADGIFLDSYGWQMNWPMTTNSGSFVCSPGEHARAVLQLTDRVRAAIRRHQPDAVVLGETASGPLGRHLDGGLSAEFAWDWTLAASRQRLLGSPVRYGVPGVSFYTNGRNLAELHQVYAAGHGLALSSLWPGSWTHVHSDHIRKLVELRQKYKDAMIVGVQEYQPHSSHSDVVAYLYRGASNVVLAIVNLSGSAVATGLQLKISEAGTQWIDLLQSGQTLMMQDQQLLDVPLEAGGLRLLLAAK